MRRRATRAALLCGGILATVLLTTLLARQLRAFDHTDSAEVVADPATDIADVYAFMRPNAGSPSPYMVVAMTVTPGATAGSHFDDAVGYRFRLRRYTDVTTLAVAPSDLAVITCTSGTSDSGLQTMTCNAAGFSKTVDVGAVTGTPTDDLRVFAGRRSDPAFADRTAIQQTVATGVLSLKPDAGVNSFAGKNVLSIVVELHVAHILNALDGGSSTPVLAVVGDTFRQ